MTWREGGHQQAVGWREGGQERADQRVAKLWQQQAQQQGVNKIYKISQMVSSGSAMRLHQTQEARQGRANQTVNKAHRFQQYEQEHGHQEHQQPMVHRPVCFCAEDSNLGFRQAMEDAYIVRDGIPPTRKKFAKV